MFILFNMVSLNLYPVDISTWYIVLISLTTLSIGYLIILFLQPDVYFAEYNRSPSAIPIEYIGKILLILSVISLIGNILFLQAVASHTGSIGEYFSNPIKARILVTKLERESIRNWDPILAFTNYVASLNLIAVLLGGYYLVFGKKYKILAFFPVLNSVIFSIITFQRYAFIQVTVTWMFCVVYSLYHQEKNIRKIQGIKIFLYIFGSSILAFVFLLGIVLARVDYGTGDVDLVGTSGWAIKSITTYIVADVVALDKFLQRTDTYLYGLSMFRSFVKWFIRIGVYDASLGLTIYNDFARVNSKTILNTYTYIRPFYEDFGLYGLLIFNFLFGAIGSFSFHSVLKKFSFLKLYIASLFFFGYFLSFFNFTLLNMTMYIFLGIIVFLLEKNMYSRVAIKD